MNLSQSRSNIAAKPIRRSSRATRKGSGETNLFRQRHHQPVPPTVVAGVEGVFDQGYHRWVRGRIQPSADGARWLHPIPDDPAGKDAGADSSATSVAPRRARPNNRARAAPVAKTSRNSNWSSVLSNLEKISLKAP